MARRNMAERKKSKNSSRNKSSRTRKSNSGHLGSTPTRSVSEGDGLPRVGT
jgi:hypothetical protein